MIMIIRLANMATDNKQMHLCACYEPLELLHNIEWKKMKCCFTNAYTYFYFTAMNVYLFLFCYK